MLMKKRTLNGAAITALLSQEQQSESRTYNNGGHWLAVSDWLLLAKWKSAIQTYRLDTIDTVFTQRLLFTLQSYFGVLLWKETCVWLLTFKVILTVTCKKDIPDQTLTSMDVWTIELQGTYTWCIILPVLLSDRVSSVMNWMTKKSVIAWFTNRPWEQSRCAQPMKLRYIICWIKDKIALAYKMIRN